MILRNFLAISLCISFISESAHARLVYVEFEGLVNQIDENTLLPGVAIGDKITGYFVVNSDEAPADTELFNPNSGNYIDTQNNPAPATFIEATTTIGGVTFHSTQFSGKVEAGQAIVMYDGTNDNYSIAESTRDETNYAWFNLIVDFQTTDDVLTGDSIEQVFDWYLEPNTTPYLNSFFSYMPDNNSEIQVWFGITHIKSGFTPPPVNLNGTVRSAAGQDICAMVLASGQYTFSCNPIGVFSLMGLPREGNGTVKRQIYADGFFPKIDILPDTSGDEVVMTRSGTCPSYSTPYDPAVAPGSAGKSVSISGKVLSQDSQTPVCAMVLANGQYTFSCDETGSYALNIPLDTNGLFKLQVYADGFAPTIQTFDEFQTSNDVRMARAAECQ